MNRFEVEVYGPPGSGKTVALAGLYLYLNGRREGRPDHLQVTAGTSRMLKELSAGKPPPATPLILGTGRAAGAEVDVRASPDFEAATFSWQDREIAFTSHAGEELRNLMPEKPGAGFSTEELLKRFKSDGARILVAVLNPFLCDEELAKDALLSLVATIQGNIGLDIFQAIDFACELLFHKRLSYMKTTFRGVEDDLAAVPQGAPPDLRRRQARSGRAASATPVQCSDNLIRTLKGIAAHIVGNELTDFHNIRSVVHQLHDRAVVQLTHVDLLDLMPGIPVSRLLRIFDDIFGTGDRRASQQVLGPNLGLVLLKADEPSYRVLRVDQDAARQLFKGVETQIARQEQRAAKLADRMTRAKRRDEAKAAEQTEYEEVRFGDLLKEAAYRSFTASPLAVAVALAVAWWWGCQGVGFVLWTIGCLAGLFAAALVLVWLRLQWLKPRWSMKADGSGNRRLILKARGREIEAAPERLQVRASWLGRLLNCGWVTADRNRVRRFPAPQLRRLMACSGFAPTALAVCWWQDPLVLAIGAILFGAAFLLPPRQQEPAPSAELRAAQSELEKTRKELESQKIETDQQRAAMQLLRAARRTPVPRRESELARGAT